MFGRKHQEIETILGPDTNVKGSIEVKGTLRIDGLLEGDIRADWLIIGKTGHVKGDIHVRGAVVGGKIEGNILSSDLSELQNSSEVYGDIHTEKLLIMEGAVFRGHSFMGSGVKTSDKVVSPLFGQDQEHSSDTRNK